MTLWLKVAHSHSKNDTFIKNTCQLNKHFFQIPENHIGNSRDTSFEHMIKRETNGRGVDLVLNSLSEEKLQASIRCLAKGGRFIEIGKFDIANNNPLSKYNTVKSFTVILSLILTLSYI